MDAGKLDFSNQEVFSGPDIGEIPIMYDLFDDLFNDAPYACTHTHICNPPGPDSAPHTHTCVHVHSKIVPVDNVGTNDTEDSSEKESKKRRPLGNREAVRKYREKKKAKAASLEDEVVRLRSVNQELEKRLQGVAVLKAENARLKRLLVDIRGRIEGSLGIFNTLNSMTISTNLPGTYIMNPCNSQCCDQVHCPHPGVEGTCGGSAGLIGQVSSSCDLDNLQCLANQDSSISEFTGGGLRNMLPNDISAVKSMRQT